MANTIEMRTVTATPQAARVVIIGAGLSGLAAAYRIRQRIPHVELTVLEERSRIGGNIWTEYADGYTVEHGPNGFLDGKPATMQLCIDLGLQTKLIAGSEAARKNRYLYVKDALHCLPGNPLGLLKTSLLTWPGKLAMLAEPFRRRGNATGESVAAFARRRFGREAADLFLDALVTGIYAGDPEQLGVEACFPRLVKMERESCSVFKGFLRASKLKRRVTGKSTPQQMWSFPGGLRVLVEALEQSIDTKVLTGVNIQSIRHHDNNCRIHGEGKDSWDADVVIDTSPAYRQAEHVADMDMSLAGELGGIRYNKIAVAVLGFRRADTPKQPEGFGYIAPQNTRRDVLGVQWCNSIYPGQRAPEGHVLWRALCGGTNRADMADLPDDQLMNVVLREMQITMGVTAKPVFTRIVRWPKAIPQYAPDHMLKEVRIEQLLRQHRGLLLGGNAHRGVAMSDCSDSAVILAEQVIALLGDRA